MPRPRKEIDKEHFESLCNLQCTLSEIAGFFKCSEDTIENWCLREYEERFSDVYKKYSQNGKISLRRYQFELAKRNASVAIWLGKNWLGQTDRQEIVVNGAESKDAMDKYLEVVKSGKVKQATKDKTN